MNSPGQQRLREHPSVRFAENEQVFRLSREIDALMKEDSGRHGHREKALFKHGPMTFALYCFEKGAQLPDHVVDGDVIIQVLEGRVSVSTGEHEHRLEGGDMIVLAPGVGHDVEAEEPSRMLITFCLESEKKSPAAGGS